MGLLYKLFRKKPTTVDEFKTELHKHGLKEASVCVNYYIGERSGPEGIPSFSVLFCDVSYQSNDIRVKKNGRKFHVEEYVEGYNGDPRCGLHDINTHPTIVGSLQHAKQVRDILKADGIDCKVLYNSRELDENALNLHIHEMSQRMVKLLPLSANSTYTTGTGPR